MLLLLLALLTVLSLTSVLPSHAQGSRVTDRTIKGQDFMNTFGVVAHFDKNNNAYSNTEAIADQLNVIGFSRIRATCENDSDISYWNAIAKVVHDKNYFSAGLKADVLMSGYMNDPVTFTYQQSTIPNIAGLLETIEGPNEIFNDGGGIQAGNGTHRPFDTPNATNDASGNWYPAADNQTSNYPANYAAWAQAIYNWKTSTPSLSNVKLLAPTIASGVKTFYDNLPDVSAYVDSGNFHFYANARQPSNFGGGNFSYIYDWYKAPASPSKPASVSECGQTTSMTYHADTNTYSGCDYPTQAKFILNQLCDATAKGVYRAYIYQLMDDTPDGEPGNTNPEAHFGIFDYQWHIKPAGQALANVKNLLADTTTNFTAQVPNYSISGVTNAGASGSSFSVSKSDGSTFVTVWNEPQIWNAATYSPVTPPSDPVTVNFGGTYNYKVFDPLTGIAAIAAGSGTSVVVNLTGSPLMIQLIPMTVMTASASFVKADTTTLGNWKGVYGSDGYNIARDTSANNPRSLAYGTVSITAPTYVWSYANYPAALQKAATGTDRIAAQWYGNPSFDVDCNLTDSSSHQVALYLIDWDSRSRNETVQVIDAGTNQVLDSRTLTSFSGGTWLVWNITGHVRFHLINNADSNNNATLSGIFFGT